MNTIDQLEHLATLPATPNDDTARIAQTALANGQRQRTRRTATIAATTGLLGAGLLTAGYLALPQRATVDVAASPTPTHATASTAAASVPGYAKAVEALLPAGTTGQAKWTMDGLNYQTNNLVWGSIVSVTTGIGTPSSCVAAPGSDMTCTASTVPEGTLQVYGFRNRPGAATTTPDHPWRVVLVRSDGTYTGVTLDGDPGKATTQQLARVVRSDTLHLSSTFLRTNALPSSAPQPAGSTSPGTPSPTGR